MFRNATVLNTTETGIEKYPAKLPLQLPHAHMLSSDQCSEYSSQSHPLAIEIQCAFVFAFEINAFAIVNIAMSNPIYAKLPGSDQIDSTDSLFEPPKKTQRTLVLLLFLSILINFSLLAIFVIPNFTALHSNQKPLAVPLPVNSKQQDFWGAGKFPKSKYRVPLLTIPSPRPF